MQAATVLGLLLQRIEHNPGVLPLKEGQALIINDKWTLVKILDLGLLRKDLELNINKYALLNNHVSTIFKNKPLRQELNDIKIQTDYVKNLTLEKLSELLPSKRVKRGLLNPLGSIIKLVSGNLDNEDALRYDALISDVRSKQSAVNKKVTIIAEMLKSVAQISNNTKNNFIQIDKAITDISKQLNSTIDNQSVLKAHNVFNLFLHNFQILCAKLEEIENIIAFSKLGMLHQAILDTNELLVLLQTIEKHNKLIFPANSENILKLEQCIDLKVYVKENQLTFILDIPLVENDVYTYYKILPLPVTNTLNQTCLILPKFPYLLAKGSKTTSFHRPCREIDELLFLCEEDYSSSLVKDMCVSNLVTFAEDTTQCVPVPVNIENIKVEKIQPDRWMVYTKQRFLLTQSCEQGITYHHLQGTYILTTDDACEAEIKGVKLRKHQGDTQEVHVPALPIINLPEVPPPKETSLELRPINLDEVELSNLEHLSNVLTKSENGQYSESSDIIQVKHVGIGTVLLYVILIVIIIFYVRNYVIRNFWARTLPPENFELREGEVMHSGHTVTIATSAD